jgi:hypothetical protein
MENLNEEQEIELIAQEANELKKEFSELKEVFAEFLASGILGNISAPPEIVNGSRVQDNSNQQGGV